SSFVKAALDIVGVEPQSIISRTRLRISNEEVRGLARLRPLIEKCPAGPGLVRRREQTELAARVASISLLPRARSNVAASPAWPSIWARAARAVPPDELEPDHQQRAKNERLHRRSIEPAKQPRGSHGSRSLGTSLSATQARNLRFEGEADLA